MLAPIRNRPIMPVAWRYSLVNGGAPPPDIGIPGRGHPIRRGITPAPLPKCRRKQGSRRNRPSPPGGKQSPTRKGIPIPGRKSRRTSPPDRSRRDRRRRADPVETMPQFVHRSPVAGSCAAVPGPRGARPPPPPRTGRRRNTATSGPEEDGMWARGIQGIVPSFRELRGLITHEFSTAGSRRQGMAGACDLDCVDERRRIDAGPDQQQRESAHDQQSPERHHGGGCNAVSPAVGRAYMVTTTRRS